MPEFVLLDVHLPKIDGLQVLERLRPVLRDHHLVRLLDEQYGLLAHAASHLTLSAGGALYPPRGTCQQKESPGGRKPGMPPTAQERSYRLAASRSFSAAQTAGSSAPSASPCSSSQRSASMAARQPSPAAVTAWR